MFQGFIQQLIGDADESDEERAERLEGIAENHNIDPITLYNLEQEVRNAARSLRSQHGDKLDSVSALENDPKTAQFSGIFEMLGSEAVVVDLGSRVAVQNPQLSAEAVYSLHTAFVESGIYDDLGVDVSE